MNAEYLSPIKIANNAKKENYSVYRSRLSFGVGAKMVETYTRGKLLIFAEGTPQEGTKEILAIVNPTAGQIYCAKVQEDEDGGTRYWFELNFTHYKKKYLWQPR